MNNNLLLHICCGPCATYPLEIMGEKYNTIFGFFYNPNINPYREYKKRLENAIKTTEYYGVILDVLDHYPMEGFIFTAGSETPGRCETCYRIRLGRAAKRAREKGFSDFTTTLLISPYQNHEEIIKAGKMAGDYWGVNFIAPDLARGFQRSRELAKKLKLYRQGYCGCIFSEKERYYRGG